MHRSRGYNVGPDRSGNCFRLLKIEAHSRINVKTKKRVRARRPAQLVVGGGGGGGESQETIDGFTTLN